jgi:transcriptional regulator with XRE-family HTH domain
MMATRQAKRKWQRTLAERIKALRRAAGLTQEGLAEKADISPEYLSRLETTRQVPSLDTVVDLAEALQTTPAALLADPKEEAGDERIVRIAAMLGGVDEGAAAFVEAQIADWVNYLAAPHREKRA